MASFLLLVAALVVHARPATDLDTNATLDSPLFPISPQLSYWSTSTSIPGALPLADSTFQLFKDITALPHPYVVAPDGELSMQAFFPAGSYDFDHSPRGGISFYAPGPSSVNLTTAKEATFGFTTYFPAGFDFVKGGKIPGLCEHARALPHLTFCV